MLRETILSRLGGLRGCAVLGFVWIAGAAACGPASPRAPANLTQGVWIGEGGQDQFLFDLRGTPDFLHGFVHVMRDGKMVSQLEITRASYRPPELEMFIERTNATYRGTVDPEDGRVVGSLKFGREPGPAMALRWADPVGMPGFAAVPREGEYTYREPPADDDGWDVATPGEAGLDRAAVEALVRSVTAGDAGLIHSLIVVRGGQLVLEEYFHGFTSTDLHRLASITKSVASLLVGAAIDRRLISGVDVPLSRYFDSVHPSWRSVTLDHLLTMSMGLESERGGQVGEEGSEGMPFQRILERRVVDPPGTRWEYVSANVDLIAGVIRRASGRHADAFAEEVLFSPLRIATYDWEYGRKDGYNLMSGSLHLRPRDLAKIGAVVAGQGRWRGKQVISEAWIRKSTRLRFQTGELLSGYGSLWWLGELPCGHGAEPIIVANGWGSQFIVVFPHLDLVVVTTGGNDDNGRHMDIGGVLTRTLLPTM